MICNARFSWRNHPNDYRTNTANAYNYSVYYYNSLKSLEINNNILQLICICDCIAATATNENAAPRPSERREYSVGVQQMR